MRFYPPPPAPLPLTIPCVHLWPFVSENVFRSLLKKSKVNDFQSFTTFRVRPSVEGADETNSLTLRVFKQKCLTQRLLQTLC